MDLDADGVCAVCGLPITIGQWPCITTIRPHEVSVQTAPFLPYFDIGLGREVTSLGDRWAGMRRAHRDYRDHPSAGDRAARRDRIRDEAAQRATRR